MRHLIDPLDFTEEETTRILDLAERISDKIVCVRGAPANAIIMNGAGLPLA